MYAICLLHLFLLATVASSTVQAASVFGNHAETHKISFVSSDVGETRTTSSILREASIDHVIMGGDTTTTRLSRSLNNVLQAFLPTASTSVDNKDNALDHDVPSSIVPPSRTESVTSIDGHRTRTLSTRTNKNPMSEEIAEEDKSLTANNVETKSFEDRKAHAIALSRQSLTGISSRPKREEERTVAKKATVVSQARAGTTRFRREFIRDDAHIAPETKLFLLPSENAATLNGVASLRDDSEQDQSDLNVLNEDDKASTSSETSDEVNNINAKATINACRCEYPNENLYSGSLDAATSPVGSGKAGNSKATRGGLKSRDSRVMHGSRRRLMGSSKGGVTVTSTSVGLDANSDMYVQVDGVSVLPRDHVACVGVEFICPGTDAVFPLWEYQCTATQPDVPPNDISTGGKGSIGKGTTGGKGSSGKGSVVIKSSGKSGGKSSTSGSRGHARQNSGSKKSSMGMTQNRQLGSNKKPSPGMDKIASTAADARFVWFRTSSAGTRVEEGTHVSTDVSNIFAARQVGSASSGSPGISSLLRSGNVMSKGKGGSKAEASPLYAPSTRPTYTPVTSTSGDSSGRRSVLLPKDNPICAFDAIVCGEDGVHTPNFDNGPFPAPPGVSPDFDVASYFETSAEKDTTVFGFDSVFSRTPAKHNVFDFSGLVSRPNPPIPVRIPVTNDGGRPIRCPSSQPSPAPIKEEVPKSPKIPPTTGIASPWPSDSPMPFLSPSATPIAGITPLPTPNHVTDSPIPKASSKESTSAPSSMNSKIPPTIDIASPRPSDSPIPSPSPSANPSDGITPLPTPNYATDSPIPKASSKDSSSTPSLIQAVPPVNAPIVSPNAAQTYAPTASPTQSPTVEPTATPTPMPSLLPTAKPTTSPIVVLVPTTSPTHRVAESFIPISIPTFQPTSSPSMFPLLSSEPSRSATQSQKPIQEPSTQPSKTSIPSSIPSNLPTFKPTPAPSAAPTPTPGSPPPAPSAAPTPTPGSPTPAPTTTPTKAPTDSPTSLPTESPTAALTGVPTAIPTISPTTAPTDSTIPKSPPSVGTSMPSSFPTSGPSNMDNESRASISSNPSRKPSTTPSISFIPSPNPSDLPRNNPTPAPTSVPGNPTETPTAVPTKEPIETPASDPTLSPILVSTFAPTLAPTRREDSIFLREISGIVKEDTDNDGSGNKAQAGVLVVLTGANETVIRNTTTDSMAHFLS